MSDLPAQMAATIPVVRDRWDADVRVAGIGVDEPYNQMTVLAQVLVANHADLTDDLARLFDAFENHLAAADPGARNLLIVGFLEDLQNASLHANLSLDWWSDWFGPLTREAWSTVQALWSGTISAAAFNAFVDQAPGDIPGP